MKVLFLAKDHTDLVHLESYRDAGDDLMVVSCIDAHLDFFLYKGYNAIDSKELFTMANMKIDFLIGNPPYSDRSNADGGGKGGGSKDMDDKFVLWALEHADRSSIIFRSKHFTKWGSKFRKKLFTSGNVAAIRHLPKSTFPGVQNTEVCILDLDKDHQGPATITFADGTVRETILTADTLIKLDSPNYEPYVEGNMEHRYIAGKYTRTELQELHVPGGKPVIEVMGRGDTPQIIKIDTSVNFPGEHTYGVVMNFAAEWGGLGKVMMKPYACGIGGSVVMLRAESAEEAELLLRHLQSDEIKERVKKNMPSFHPTKALFRSLPDIL